MDTVLHNQTDRFAWKADDHRSADQWLYELTPSDLRELDEAVKAVRSRGLAPPGYSAGDFPIPTFGQRLAQQARQLEYGCGFFLVNNSFLCVYHRVGDDLICSHHPYLSLRHLIHQSPRYQAKLLTDTENAPAVHAIAAARII